MRQCRSKLMRAGVADHVTAESAIYVRDDEESSEKSEQKRKRGRAMDTHTHTHTHTHALQSFLSSSLASSRQCLQGAVLFECLGDLAHADDGEVVLLKPESAL
jgi:hypothetical protein